MKRNILILELVKIKSKLISYNQIKSQQIFKFEKKKLDGLCKNILIWIIQAKNE